MDRPNLSQYSLKQIEEFAIQDHLTAAGGDKRKAARTLGVCEKTIYNWLARLAASVNSTDRGSGR